MWNDMQFRDVIGQDTIKAGWRRAIEDSRVPHAQLLLAPEGSGGLPLAISFATYLMCEGDRGEDACGTCPSCQKIEKLAHPDLHFTYPVVRQKNPPISADYIKEWREAVKQQPYMNVFDWLQFINAENKQGNITARECQEVVNKLGLKTYESKYKVLILWGAEALAKEGNRLLKLIEEPPDNTFILLIAESEDAILNTIRSRCQIYRLEHLTDDEVGKYLEEHTTAHQHIRAQAVRLAEGNLRMALQLAHESEGELNELFLVWMRLCYDPIKATELLEWIERAARLGREQQKQFVQVSLHNVREAVRMAHIPGYDPRLSQELLRFADFMAEQIPLEGLEQLAIQLENLHYFIERNANPRIQLLHLSLQVQELFSTRQMSGSQRILA